MKKYIVPAVIAKTQDELDEIFIKISNHASLIQLAKIPEPRRYTRRRKLNV